MLIRRFSEKDVAATAQLFFDSVRHGAIDVYDEAQRHAWAPQVPEPSRWRDRLKPQTVLIAERRDGIIGFMTLTADGKIDLAYVAPHSIGQGVAKALYDAILLEAAGIGLSRLTVEASHLARAFFERQGWSVVTPQTVVRDGVSLTNFAMEKKL